MNEVTLGVIKYLRSISIAACLGLMLTPAANADTFYFRCSGSNESGDFANDFYLDFDTSEFSDGFNPFAAQWEYDGQELRIQKAGYSFEAGFWAFNVASVSFSRNIINSDGIAVVDPKVDYNCTTNGLDVLEQLPLSENRLEREAAIKATQLGEKISKVTPEKLEELKVKCTKSVLISGICWRQSFDEMQLVMTGRGFECEGSVNDLASVYGFKFICEKGDAWVRVEENRIVFSCDTFNTCSYSVEETAKLLVDNGLIDKLVPRVTVVNDRAFKEYCGRGKDQEELCSAESSDLLGQPTVVVQLDRGASGEAAPSFD